MSQTKEYCPHSAKMASMNTPLAGRSLVDYVLYDYWEENQDPTASHLPLVGGGPWKVLGIVGLYLLAIVIGKRMMKNRQPYACTTAMKYYNLFNVIANLAGFIAAFVGTNFGLDVWGCKKKYFAPHLLLLGYGYLLLKFVDFLDTLFFILRKKDNQITFLHVTHHCLMPITCYVGLKFVPYGNTGFTPLINSFVHVVMYWYYYLAGMGYQNSLWWKKYITVVQLVQFAIGIVHALQIYYVPGCDYPWGVATFELLEAIYFFTVFFNFYRRSYWKSKSSKACSNSENNNVKSKSS